MTLSKSLKIGMIGLDTSHAPAFIKILNDSAHLHHVSGVQVVAAFPGGSPLAISANRVEKFTEEIRDSLKVPVVDSIDALPSDLDAIFILSVVGSQHLEQFEKIVARKVPVFIDKPLATTASDARRIKELADAAGVRVMAASAIRFMEPLVQARESLEGEPISGADVYGPMAFTDGIPPYHWYGIHSAEMLFALFGKGCTSVEAIHTDDHDVIVGKWADGRIGVVRGTRTGNGNFGGTIHTAKDSVAFSAKTATKPYYASLLENIGAFLKEGKEVVDFAESVEVIRFLDAANESRDSGKIVKI